MLPEKNSTCSELKTGLVFIIQNLNLTKNPEKENENFARDSIIRRDFESLRVKERESDKTTNMLKRNVK